MAEYLRAEKNGRTIPKEDKIFGINNRAQAAIAKKGKANVINATAGTFLDDKGNYIILPAVAKVLSSLRANDYAEYAPIGGTPDFKKAIKRAAFGAFEPGSCTEAVATIGGTGGIRLAVSNYSKAGDTVLTSDWYWAAYKSIIDEQGRNLATYEFLTQDGTFNKGAFAKKIEELLSKQDSLLIIINTPAHNPTGYSLTTEDWRNAIDAMGACGADKRINVFVDTAYMDFAGDESEVRSFLPLIDRVPGNVFPMIGYSASKTFTLYGYRCGAIICMASTEEEALEFKQVCEFSARATWSNAPRGSQTAIALIYADEQLQKQVDSDRRKARAILLARGKTFNDAAQRAGLEIVPYDAGFFASVPCHNPEAVCAELEKQDIYLVPLAKGIRVSIASIPESVCAVLPEKIKAVMVNE